MSAAPSQGTYAAATGTWAVGALPNQASATLAVTAVVSGTAPVTNTATVTHSDQFDPNAGNNSATTTATPQLAALTLTKVVDNPQPAVHALVTYTFVVSNAGPGRALDVRVSDPFPPGLTFVSAAVPTQGSYDPTTGTWSVGTLEAGARASLQVVARVDVAGPVVNSAVAGAVGIDPSLSDLTASAPVTGERTADLISKFYFLSLP